MERKWKERYSQKFRRRAVARMNACENIVRLSRDLGVCCTLLYKWRYQLEPADALSEGVASTKNSRESTLRREISKLKRLLAGKAVEVDFFKGALQRRHRLDFVVDAFSPVMPLFWRRASTFCKAPLKRSSSSAFSASTRFNWLISFRSVDSRAFPGGDSSLSKASD